MYEYVRMSQWANYILTWPACPCRDPGCIHKKKGSRCGVWSHKSIFVTGIHDPLQFRCIENLPEIFFHDGQLGVRSHWCIRHGGRCPSTRRRTHFFNGKSRRSPPRSARYSCHLQSACDIIWYNGIILYHIMQYFWVLEEYIIKLKISYDVIWYHIISHDTYYIIWYHVIWVYIFCHMMSPDVTWHHMMILNFTQWSLAGETNHVSFLQYV